MRVQKSVAEYGTWRVLADGEIRNDVRQLRIRPDRLREPDWWIKLYIGYPWMSEEWNTFIPAWVKSCEILGIKQITLQTQINQ